MAQAKGIKTRQRASATAADPTRTQVTNEVLGKAATGQRQIWEGSPEGRQRLRTTADLEGHNTSTGLPYGMSRRQFTHFAGEDKAESPNEPSLHHQQLQFPGMESPHARTRTRFEDLPQEEQERTKAALRTHAGTDIETMTHHYGAQVDQAYARGRKHGTVHPHAEQFYSEGSEVHDVMAHAARQAGVPYEHHTIATGITSPSTPFKKGNRYMNTEAALSVHEQHARGVSAEDYKLPPGVSSYPAGQVRGGKAMEHLAAGKPMHEIREGLGGKTAAFVNAFNPDAPQRFTADVHSGGGGMFPHLGTDKPKVMTQKGTERRDKSGREKAMENVPHFHEVADYAARQAMEQRGHEHLRMNQAAQWGEEQIQRKEGGVKNMPSEAEAYGVPKAPRLNKRQFKDQPKQGVMFKPTDRGSERTSMGATARGYTPHNEFTPGSQWDF